MNASYRSVKRVCLPSKPRRSSSLRFPCSGRMLLFHSALVALPAYLLVLRTRTCKDATRAMSENIQLVVRGPYCNKFCERVYVMARCYSFAAPAGYEARD